MKRITVILMFLFYSFPLSVSADEIVDSVFNVSSLPSNGSIFVNNITISSTNDYWGFLNQKQPLSKLTIQKCYTLDNCDPVIYFDGNFAEVRKTTLYRYIKVGRVYVPDSDFPVVSVTPDSGDFLDSLEVSISSDDSTAKIFYSLDGSDPSFLYSGPFRVTDTVVLKAKAIDSSGNVSSIVVRNYTKKIIQLGLVFTPDQIVIEQPFQVSIIPSPADAQVLYSIDGSDPSVPYSGSIMISKPVTLKAKVVYGDKVSNVYERTFTKPPIQHTSDKVIKVPVSVPDISKNALDLFASSSRYVWVFAVAFFGLLILTLLKRVGRK